LKKREQRFEELGNLIDALRMIAPVPRQKMRRSIWFSFGAGCAPFSRRVKTRRYKDAASLGLVPFAKCLRQAIRPNVAITI
jgi:hypothetical protein